MANILDSVQTIILVMFENRSFDHMLGHITIDDPSSKIDGLREPLYKYSNFYNDKPYQPFKIDNESVLHSDLPHEYCYVAGQLAKSPENSEYQMSGFVETYAKATNPNPDPECEPMGFFKEGLVPVTDFLAKNFCVCDRWHTSLPTGTVPNRNMAFCGESTVHKTERKLISIKNTLFKWLVAHNISWRVYHDGISFFILYNSLWKYVLGKNFRQYKHFASDMLYDAPADTPQVIIIEPNYAGMPQIASNHPNDNHPPLAIGWGENFLRRTYEAVTANKEKYGKSVMIVYYDEHGGFYDHVPPPKIEYTTTGPDPYHFESLGPRIPAIIVSPFVKQGSICNSLFDHTSVLQLLAEKFTPGKPYNETVYNRSLGEQGIKSISAALDNYTYWEPPLSPPQVIKATSELGLSIYKSDADPLSQAFEYAINQMFASHPKKTISKYPEIIEWQNVVNNRKNR